MKLLPSLVPSITAVFPLFFCVSGGGRVREILDITPGVALCPINNCAHGELLVLVLSMELLPSQTPPHIAVILLCWCIQWLEDPGNMTLKRVLANFNQGMSQERAVRYGTDNFKNMSLGILERMHRPLSSRFFLESRQLLMFQSCARKNNDTHVFEFWYHIYIRYSQVIFIITST